MQRSVKFARYLPERGYTPVVVTGPGPAVAWAPPDEALAAELPPGTEIRRLPGPEPARSGRWRGRAERWFRLRTPFARWWVDGAVAAGRAVRDAELVYASMSPFETAAAAERLARESGRPWVADLRDPWALDEWRVYPSAVHRRLELRRMRRALATADGIVMNTPEAATALLEAFPELAGKRVVTIPNGFDPVDFEGPPPSRDGGAFRIVHAGWSHSASGRRHRRTRPLRRFLGGAQPGLDILARSHVFLVEAVERLLAARPELDGVVEIHLAGLLPEDDRDAARPSFVHYHGYLPHGETVALLRSADLLFLPMHDLPEGVRSRIVPGKTYEYLAAGRPILAAVPPGDARDLLDRVGNARLCEPADVAGLERAVAAEVDRFLSGEEPAAPRADVVAGFSRPELTGKLADLFDDVLAGRAR